MLSVVYMYSRRSSKRQKYKNTAVETAEGERAKYVYTWYWYARRLPCRAKAANRRHCKSWSPICTTLARLPPAYERLGQHRAHTAAAAGRNAQQNCA